MKLKKQQQQQQNTHTNAFLRLCSYGNVELYGDRESSMRCNLRKHMQIEKAPAN